MAVNRAIRAASLDVSGLDAPLVELLRDLARQMDRSGEDGPSSRLLAAYLSATKDLRRVTSPRSVRGQAVAAESVPAVGEAGSPPALTLVKESPLDKVRNKKHAHG